MEPVNGVLAVAPGPPASVIAQQKIGEAIMIWSIGMYCVFCWEWIINLPCEINRIWKRKLSFISVLYLLNRYWGLFQFSLVVSLLTDVWNAETCSKIFRWDPVNALVSQILSHMIMATRVYAIFGQNKLIGGGLVMFIVVELVIGSYSVSLAGHPPQLPGVPCSVLGSVGWMTTFWTMFLVFDTVTFMLTAWKTIEYWRKEVNAPLIRLIWRDGLIYFATIFCMNCTNVIIFSHVSPTLRPINLEPTAMLTVIMTCRLVLNLRDFSSQGSNSTTKIGSYPPSSFVPVIHGANPYSAFGGGKNEAFLPIAVDVHRDVIVSTSQPIGHGHVRIPHHPQADYYAVDRAVTPPWERNNPMLYIHGNPGAYAAS